MPLRYDRKTGQPTFELHDAERNAICKVCATLNQINKATPVGVQLRTDADKAAEILNAIMAKFPKTVKETATA